MGWCGKWCGVCEGRGGAERGAPGAIFTDPCIRAHCAGPVGRITYHRKGPILVKPEQVVVLLLSVPVPESLGERLEKGEEGEEGEEGEKGEKCEEGEEEEEGEEGAKGE